MKVFLACTDKINAHLIIIGLNSEKVERKSKKPFLVVKKDSEKFKMKNLFFTSSFKNGDKKEVLRKLIEFAIIFDSKIHLLKETTPSNFESTFEAKKIKAFIEEFTLPKHSITIYNDISVQKEILNFSQEINAYLIALSTVFSYSTSFFGLYITII